MIEVLAERHWERPMSLCTNPKRLGMQIHTSKMLENSFLAQDVNLEELAGRNFVSGTTQLLLL